MALSALRRLQAARRRQWTVAWLAKVVRKWRPHVVHTIGLDPASYLYAEARERHGLDRFFHETHGGSRRFACIVPTVEGQNQRRSPQQRFDVDPESIAHPERVARPGRDRQGARGMIRPRMRRGFMRLTDLQFPGLRAGIALALALATAGPGHAAPPDEGGGNE